MKNAVCAALGVLGGVAAHALGGWNASLAVLVSMMAVDYIFGLIVAGVFKKSPKSESGALESRAGWKGLLRKVAVLAAVFVAAQVDVLFGSAFVRDAVVIGFCANEGLSILENVALTGVPLPPALEKSLEVLRKKSDGETAV